jgi:PIN domain nuclease of toxin-antitoxin system
MMLSLPNQHRDPFDRMLIAQALHEGFRLVTRDQEIAKYPVPQIKA